MIKRFIKKRIFRASFRIIILSIVLSILSNYIVATPPNITDVWQFPPLWIPTNNNITIYADVIDIDGNLNTVFLDVIKPNGINDTDIEMRLMGGDWKVQYNGTRRGEYRYRIHAVDMAGEENYSDYYYFYVLYLPDQSDLINVTVNVAVSCCGAITFFYVPEKIIQNQTVVFLLFFQNCGNTRLDEKINNITIYNETGSYVTSWSGPGNPVGGLDPMEESVFWTIWSTVGKPIGNYSAVGFVEYFGLISNETNVTENFFTLNETHNCTNLTADNRSNCTSIETTGCYKSPSMTNYTVVITNETSTANVSGMNEGSIAYKGGPIVINGTSYNAYVFNMTSCNEYCYACLSVDDSMDSGECSYEGYKLSIEDYFVYDVESDGSEVEFRPAEKRCDYRLTKWECVLISSNGTAICNKTIYCYGTVMEIRRFEIVEQIGERVANITIPSPESGPYPLIIREMPPQINQNPGCNPADPWNTCTYTTIRFILFNVGIANVSNLILNERGMTKNCSIGNCNSVAVRCRNTSEYTCNVLSDLSVSHVIFNLTNPLPPRKYVILEYELVPNADTSAYTNVINASYYFFNATAHFQDLSRPDRVNFTYTVYENHPIYNPLASKIMNLMNVNAFNYNISIANKNSTTGKGRDFYINTNTTFNLTIISITGRNDSNTAWTLDIPVPEHWTITDCWIPSPQYSCSFTPNSLQYSSSITPKTMKDITFKFNARVDFENFYLLPTNKTLENGLYEEYIPGLFLFAHELKEKNITQNVTVTSTVTTTVTTTVTSTITTTVTTTVTSTVTTILPEALELAIDIKPINRTVNGTQGIFNPVVFNVTNIGNVPAENITLIPIVPEGWEYKTALVSFLNVSETVNRTIFVKPPYGVTGQYVIPVKAVIGNFTADMDYFYMNVIKAVNLSVLEIIEAPKTVPLLPNKNVTISILIKNIGKLPLTDIKGRLENAELCIEEFNFETVPYMEPNETRRAYFNILTTNHPTKCDSTLILWSKENAYAFTDMTITITPPPPLIPAIMKVNLLLLLLIFLTILYVAKKSEEKRIRRGRRMRMTGRQKILKIILYLILSIIIFFLIYIGFSHVGFPRFF